MTDHKRVSLNRRGKCHVEMGMRPPNRSAEAAVLGALLAITLSPIAIAQLPNPGMEIDPASTALVITDLQNDFCSVVQTELDCEPVEEAGTVLSRERSSAGLSRAEVLK